MSDLDELEAMWALTAHDPDQPRPLRNVEHPAPGCGLLLLLAVLAASVLLVVGAVILLWLALRWAVTS